MPGLKRREFITLLGGAAAASPLPVDAQQQPILVIGFLSTVAPEGFSDRLRGFREGLREAGYMEGSNVVIEFRWAENRLERLPELGADLVRRQVSVIVASGGTAGALTAKALNTTIPIVFGIPEDPVQLGLVESLSRPGGTMTGVNFFVGELLAKRLELLRELVPTAKRVAVFVNPENAARARLQVGQLEEAARTMGVQTRIFETGTTQAINTAFEMIADERPDALFVSADPFFPTRRVQLANLAVRHAIPSSFSVREIVDAGGLMSYGPNIIDAYRQMGLYAGRILKGAKPADLPVVQSSRFELVINAQTARMLGLAVPPSLLSIADEVIE
jgi:putative ABC transport system substrate-binding protein